MSVHRINAGEQNPMEQTGVQSTVGHVPQNIDTVPNQTRPAVYSTQAWESPSTFQQGPAAQQAPAGRMVYIPAGMGTPQVQYTVAQQPMMPGIPGYSSEWKNTSAIKGVIGLICVLSGMSIIMESLSLLYNPYHFGTTVTAPGIWTGVLGLMCGCAATSSTGGKRVPAAVTFTVIYMVAIAVQMGFSAITVTVLSSCRYYDKYYCQTLSGFIAILQIGILTSGGLQGFLMLFVSGFFCKRGCGRGCSCCCCHKGTVVPENMMIPMGMTSVPIQQGLITVNEEINNPRELTNSAGGFDANITALSHRATAAVLPGRFVAKVSPRDFGIFAQNSKEKATGEQLRTVARYIYNSTDEDGLGGVLSASDCTQTHPHFSM